MRIGLASWKTVRELACGAMQVLFVDSRFGFWFVETESHYVAQADLDLSLPTSASQGLGLQAVPPLQALTAVLTVDHSVICSLGNVHRSALTLLY
jgi:hypothetical protein